MAKTTGTAARRSDALTRERLVAASIELLDAHGEAGLTFRALAARLQTGHGAIQWHIATKDELLQAATEEVVERALSEAPADAASPQQSIRAIARQLFDAIDAHPWVGTQVCLEPWQEAALRIFESLGAHLPALGVPEPAQFDSASALLSHILGLAAQYAAAVRQLAPGTERSAFLSALAARWTQLDPAQHPFLHRVAAQLADHDDREQFLAGIDLLLDGMTARR
ncbi:AcrR family transcriptional regulator [Catenulispora sp. EB89]|uniref:TetR/AcrR family transcriptional regulator n=1 Tax=Catenulispora sp. EB89 TaxID=3156257 RepID=UPI0035116D2B